ncbi:MAG: hypothetical protein HKN50_05145 [Gammaproteobacteria bacterium]|nr:hypothetical protein [Gammaproteobacteria bacterium]
MSAASPTANHNIEQRIDAVLTAQYWRDGAVLIRGAVEPHWIERLGHGVEQNIANPSERGRIWDRDDHGGVMFFDCQVWQQNKDYRDFVEQSALAEITGRLMGSSRVNFFYDAIFTRTRGNQFRTPFHQDEPYWSVQGFDTCSVWMPLVPVEKKSALEFVRGSHRWPQKFRQINFGGLTQDQRDQVVFSETDGEPFPDIEGNREQYDILSWDMQPGDIACFNGRIIHGGSGNLAPDRDLKVFNTQWAGDDVRIKFRPQGMDPDHSAVMTAAGLQPGDRLSGELYPQLWSR